MGHRIGEQHRARSRHRTACGGSHEPKSRTRSRLFQHALYEERGCVCVGFSQRYLKLGEGLLWVFLAELRVHLAVAGRQKKPRGKGRGRYGERRRDTEKEEEKREERKTASALAQRSRDGTATSTNGARSHTGRASDPTVELKPNPKTSHETLAILAAISPSWTRQT
eukprot:3936053-Rhodomonas_salina.2